MVITSDTVLQTLWMSVNGASRITIGNSRVMVQIVALLTDNSRVIIYDHIIFIEQITNINVIKRAWFVTDGVAK